MKIDVDKVRNMSTHSLRNSADSINLIRLSQAFRGNSRYALEWQTLADVLERIVLESVAEND